ncbi:UDP-2,4-diacetamido-2,4,6-trideoxy-beta-L-altropyranose hydrolase [Orenia metallireducens]|uniref:UDP-2,4-diacetamido-2,4, 6-trideoxy-beta-L-altropyranose hydrolase n=1 Tax=Orenia metallireducens TaxID=1413210 RepID=A0A1C0AB66_9FIRM|nr:UDP-2,4-diacetamido-2,4,6-trideoxy-beta-L-altropyranose hydrolase [Orenia metallireducens]OCL27611.1 UDP-2,4-diacetamido-2,4,6-trideoxy-beta-L-altropyranose hydrolase [Orenia metallireducens]
MTKIFFRVDGGDGIGMGHIMRSLALANAFPKYREVIFITKEDRNVINLFKENGIQFITISPNLTYEEEIRTIKEILLNKKVEILITDSYKIDQNYLIEMKSVVKKLISIHDFAPFSFPSDVVINGNVYGDKLDYSSISKDTEFLLGTNYLLMRDEFQRLEERMVNQEISNILVTVGGSDPLNLTPKVINSLDILEKELKKSLHVDVVIGPSFNNIDKIIEMTRKNRLEISLHFNIRKMSRLMLESDLSITAGGTTLYELAATGTPAVVLLQADNQVLAAKEMERLGTIINLGFGNKVEIEKLAATLIEIAKNEVKRKKMSKVGQKLVDGYGATRCVERILN